MSKIKLILFIFSILSLSFLNLCLFDFVHAYEECGDDEVCLSNPIETDSPQVFIGQIVDASLGVVGSLALLMFVYGGFTWMLASGNSERVEKGKNILFWATVGLVVIFTSYVYRPFRHLRTYRRPRRLILGNHIGSL